MRGVNCGAFHSSRPRRNLRASQATNQAAHNHGQQRGPAKEERHLAARRAGGEELGRKRKKAEERARYDSYTDSIAYPASTRAGHLQCAQARDERQDQIIADEIPGDVSSNHTRIIA